MTRYVKLTAPHHIQGFMVPEGKILAVPENYTVGRSMVETDANGNKLLRKPAEERTEKRTEERPDKGKLKPAMPLHGSSDPLL